MAVLLCLKVSVADVTSEVLWEVGCPPLAFAWGPPDPRSASAVPARWGCFLLSPAGLAGLQASPHGAALLLAALGRRSSGGTARRVQPGWARSSGLAIVLEPR